MILDITVAVYSKLDLIHRKGLRPDVVNARLSLKISYSLSHCDIFKQLYLSVIFLQF